MGNYLFILLLLETNTGWTLSGNGKTSTPHRFYKLNLKHAQRLSKSHPERKQRKSAELAVEAITNFLLALFVRSSYRACSSLNMEPLRARDHGALETMDSRNLLAYFPSQLQLLHDAVSIS